MLVYFLLSINGRSMFNYYLMESSVLFLIAIDKIVLLLLRLVNYFYLIMQVEKVATSTAVAVTELMVTDGLDPPIILTTKSNV